MGTGTGRNRAPEDVRVAAEPSPRPVSVSDPAPPLPPSNRSALPGRVGAPVAHSRKHHRRTPARPHVSPIFEITRRGGPNRRKADSAQRPRPSGAAAPDDRRGAAERPSPCAGGAPAFGHRHDEAGRSAHGAQGPELGGSATLAVTGTGRPTRVARRSLRRLQYRPEVRGPVGPRPPRPSGPAPHAARPEQCGAPRRRRWNRGLPAQEQRRPVHQPHDRLGRLSADITPEQGAPRMPRETRPANGGSKAERADTRQPNGHPRVTTQGFKVITIGNHMIGPARILRRKYPCRSAVASPVPP